MGDENEACKAHPHNWNMHCAAEGRNLVLLRGWKERHVLLFLVVRGVFCWPLLGVARSVLYVLFHTTSHLNYPQGAG